MVSNIINQNGNAAANQFLIIDEYGNKFFQSYTSMICKVDARGHIEITDKWTYSRTTMKYTALFLKNHSRYYVSGKKDIENLIKNGNIKVVSNIENK